MAAFCVVLRPRFWKNCGHARNKRFYLSADNAERAIRLAIEDNPGWTVVGIEPSRLSASPSSDHPASASDTKNAA
jgi:hypothetical protein